MLSAQKTSSSTAEAAYKNTFIDGAIVERSLMAYMNIFRKIQSAKIMLEASQYVLLKSNKSGLFEVLPSPIFSEKVDLALQLFFTLKRN